MPETRSLRPPPAEVGEEAFFQVPEFGQLPQGSYKQVGRCVVQWKGVLHRFYILRYLEKLVVGQTLEEVPAEKRFALSGGALVPPQGNFYLKVAALEQLPTGEYRLIGTGNVKEYSEVSPTQLFVLETGGHFVAVRNLLLKDVAVGSKVDIVRKGRTLRIGFDRRVEKARSTLNEKLLPTTHSVYEWVENGLVLLQHLHPEQAP